MEGIQGQLHNPLPDGLGGNDADGFAQIDRRSTSQIATVAGGANATFGFAGQSGTDLDRFHLRFIDLLSQRFIDERAFLGNLGGLESIKRQKVLVNRS